ncbi:hypothetical protein LTSEJOH_1747, partial [Salmonella enterica subsp. enterica serovar Johannesburg str. S5-703]
VQADEDTEVSQLPPEWLKRIVVTTSTLLPSKRNVKISMDYQSGTDPISAASLDKRHNIPRLYW